MPRPSRAFPTALFALLVAGCSPSSSASVAGTAAASSATASSPTATSAIDPLAACPSSQTFASLTTVAHQSAADDIAVASDGSLWISDAQSTLVHVSASGAVLQQIDDPRAPEGIAVLGNGTLLVAEQGPDRIVQLQPATQHETTLLQLTPRAGAEGVDGIGYDVTTNSVLVPDSPNGTLLEVSLTTRTETRLAAGLGRPVGAAALPDGRIVVSAEDESGLLVVPKGGGTATPLGSVVQGDDVVVVRGVVYVTSLGSGRVLAVNPANGSTVTLVDHVSMPQGLAVLGATRLAVADSSSGSVAAFNGC